ncbi:acyltransferase, partial [Oharaeibacter diazotrophicus]
VAVVVGAIVAVAAWRLALALGGAAPARTYAGLDTRADALLIGCALALAGVEAVPERLVRALAPIALAVLVAVFVRLGWTSRVMAMGGFTVVALCAAVLVVAAHRPGRIGRCLLGNRLVLWVGARSYGIYLWHVPMLFLAFRKLGANPASALLALAGTIALAALSYRWI